jgi:hypothetical protein
MKTIEDLRETLFTVIESVQHKDNPMPIDQAKMVAELAQTIINTAKVEVDYLRATDEIKGSGFISANPRGKEIPEHPLTRGKVASIPGQRGKGLVIP